MPAPEIYIDTSVIGGYFEDEFKADTHIACGNLKRGDFIAL